MKLEAVKVADAVGALLAHTTRAGSLTLKKGRQLSAEDCKALAKADVEVITVARLGPSDVHEDDAAARIANALAGRALSLSPAFTGRCNLQADQVGLIDVDGERIDQANAVNEALTIATLPPLAKAGAGQTVATVKVIPFAVEEALVTRVIEILEGSERAVSVLPFTGKSVAVVNTLLPQLKQAIVDKTTDLTIRRVNAVGSEVTAVFSCAHTADAVGTSLQGAVSASVDLIVVVGASVTVDRDDVVPAGIRGAGGEIVHYGMPVDPGNLMVLARIGDTPVLVLPGCARSPKLNGIDWVLERWAAGVPVGSREIMAMGVGGLLVDSPVRPLPRDEAVQKQPRGTDRCDVAAVVLAAGQSRRMGGTNKLLRDVGGYPLVRRVVQAAINSKAEPVVVVTGHNSGDIAAALDGLQYVAIQNDKFAEGLSTSLAAGLDAVPESCGGAVVCLGDMPDVSASHIDKLIEGFEPDQGRAIGVPVHQGKRGNPVLWARRFFSAMTEVKGDVGARHLIGDYEDLVYEVEFGDTAVLTDLDTPEAWAAYTGPVAP